MAMIQNTVYILGAGASFHAVPTVEEIKELMPFHFFFNIQGKEFSNISNEEKDELEQLIKELNSDFVEIGRKIHSAFSFDTQAKFFYLQNNLEEYEKVKFFIQEFFLYSYFIRQQGNSKVKIDNRYQAFLAAICNNSKGRLELPKNVSVLSYNYDIQFETVVQQLIGENDIKTYLKSSTIPITFNPDLNLFTLIKLNGSISNWYSLNSNDIYLDEYFSKKMNSNISEIDYLKGLLERYKRFSRWHQYSQDQASQYNKSGISFAWESDKTDLNKQALELIKKARNIVVIGYSFPTFNRQFDKKWLNQLPTNCKLIIQDPDANSILERLTDINPQILSELKNNLIIKTDCKEFYVPNDLI